ncbi:MAG: hypothetical protein M0R03_21345 [Novosphingobium sp.]|nr:hypothetical protein [Novosphingobium sp.]
MTTEEFLKNVCPNHTDKSKWNKSELLYILELHTEQLRKHAVISSVCPCSELPNGEIAISSKALQKPYGDFG